MAGCKCKTTDICVDSGAILRERFPYVRTTMEGELVIPMEKVEDFVRRFNEMLDAEEHAQQLRAYRANGVRKPVTESDE